MIKWDAQYELGIKSIDDQHKRLVELTSELSDLLTNAVDGEDVYDEMVRIIKALTDYTVYHFKYEESLMEKVDFEHIESHIGEHNKLIQEIQNLDLRAVDEDQVAYGKKILKFLITWVFKHISGSDFMYRDKMLSFGIH